MAAESADKSEVDSPCAAGKSEAAAAHYVEIEQFAHLGAVTGFLVLAEYVNSRTELDHYTWR